MSKKITVNIQGLSRRSIGLLSPIKPKKGNIFISLDLSQGEPTVTSHYSKDPLYTEASFGMIGQTPHYNKQGVLLIDDIYVMTASKAPMFRDTVRDFFDFKYLLTDKGWVKGSSGLCFQDAWLKDKEGIQGLMKKPFRQASKTNCLGISYSMGPKKMVTNAYLSGFSLDLPQAQEFYKTYWNMYWGVRQLEKRLQAECKKKGYLVNAFGYRIIPDSEHKVLNYFIQSSVSGIMHVLSAKYKALYPKALYVATIHDENIYEIPEDDLEVAKARFFEAVDSLNNDLKWSVPMRCGWVTGRDLYEAK